MNIYGVTIHTKYLPHDSFFFIFTLKIKLGIFPEFWFWTAIRSERVEILT